VVTPGGQRGGGRVLARRYHLQRVLGRGAMGAVWEAEDTFLRRTVAVKEVVIPGSLSPDERAVSVERTLREARAIARLGHPNVVTLFDVLDEDARPWVVMELVPSRSLAEVIKEDGPLHPLRVATVGLAILGALEAAHAAGITHRDVKPGNILLGHDGRVKLTDFGIARAVGDDTITGTGLLVGSPSYIAPEIVKGQEAGAPADLWGLGATLYAAVEGRAPFSGGDAMETLSKVVQEPPTPPVRAGSLGPALDAMLEKDPTRRARPVDARRLLLDVLRGGSDEPARPPRPAARPTPVPPPPPAPTGPGLADLLVPVWRDQPEGAPPGPPPAPARTGAGRAGAAAGPATGRAGATAGPATGGASAGAAAAGAAGVGTAAAGAAGVGAAGIGAAAAGVAVRGAEAPAVSPPDPTPTPEAPTPDAAAPTAADSTAVPADDPEAGAPAAAAVTSAAPAGSVPSDERAAPDTEAPGSPAPAADGPETAMLPTATPDTATPDTAAPEAEAPEAEAPAGSAAPEVEAPAAPVGSVEDLQGLSDLVDPDVADPDLVESDLDGDTRIDLGLPAGPGRPAPAAAAGPRTEPVPVALDPAEDVSSLVGDTADGAPEDAPVRPQDPPVAEPDQSEATVTLAADAAAAAVSPTGAASNAAPAAASNAAPTEAASDAAAAAAAPTAAYPVVERRAEDAVDEATVTLAAPRRGEPVREEPVTPRRPAYGAFGIGAPPDGDSELPTQMIAPLPFGGPAGGAPAEPARAFRAQPPTPGPLGFPAERPRSDRRRRSLAALLVAVGLVVVVVLGAGLLVRGLRGDGDGGGRAGGDPGGPTATAGPAPTPAGYTRYAGAGFQVAVPKGWPAEAQREGVVDVKQPGSNRFLRLITVESTSPALQQLTAAERQFAADPSYQDYRRVRLATVDYRGLDAADWEFTFTLNGVPRHVIYRGIVTGGKTYGLYLSTQADQWASSKGVLQVAADTFTTT
jgi:eukaryotic-like serine/threonine-protein kinase